MLEIAGYVGLLIILFRLPDIFPSMRVFAWTAVLYVAVAFVFTVRFNFFEDWITPVAALAYPITIFLLVRPKHFGLKYITAFGFLLNTIAIWANGGRMPVIAENEYGWVHAPLDADTKFVPLCDIFENGAIGRSTYSIGDCFIYSGLVVAGIIILVRAYRDDVPVCINLH